MPGYEPFLLCDFHVHTTWSDGQLALAEVIDLYGSTGKFDVIAITDHILMKKDLMARMGRIATLGRALTGSSWVTARNDGTSPIGSTTTRMVTSAETRNSRGKGPTDMDVIVAASEPTGAAKRTLCPGYPKAERLAPEGGNLLPVTY